LLSPCAVNLIGNITTRRLAIRTASLLKDSAGQGSAGQGRQGRAGQLFQVPSIGVSWRPESISISISSPDILD
jgi:hypothetical protein